MYTYMGSLSFVEEWCLEYPVLGLRPSVRYLNEGLSNLTVCTICCTYPDWSPSRYTPAVMHSAGIAMNDPQARFIKLGWDLSDFS